MTAKTTVQRVQALRLRRTEAGLSEVRNIWAPAELHGEIRAAAAKLARRRERAAAAPQPSQNPGHS